MRMEWIGLEKVFAIQSAINDHSYSYFILYLTLKELDTLQIQGIHLHLILRAGCVYSVYDLSRTTMYGFRAGLKPNAPSGATEDSIGPASPKTWVGFISQRRNCPIYITRYSFEASKNSNGPCSYQVDNSVYYCS